ncbi:hypothetical protein BC828DRAFT_389065, partial [Blastocladiella britannica]
CPNHYIGIPMPIFFPVSNQSGFLVDIPAGPSMYPMDIQPGFPTAIPISHLSSSSARTKYFQ